MKFTGGWMRARQTPGTADGIIYSFVSASDAVSHPFQHMHLLLTTNRDLSLMASVKSNYIPLRDRLAAQESVRPLHVAQNSADRKC